MKSTDFVSYLITYLISEYGDRDNGGVNAVPVARLLLHVGCCKNCSMLYDTPHKLFKRLKKEYSTTITDFIRAMDLLNAIGFVDLSEDGKIIWLQNEQRKCSEEV